MTVHSVVSVAEEGIWQEIDAVVAPDLWVQPVVGTVRRVAAGRERALAKALDEAGLRVLVRSPQRVVEQKPHVVRVVPEGLSAQERAVLASLQRHAVDGVVYGDAAFDPEEDRAAIRGLLGAGLIVRGDGAGARWFVDPELCRVASPFDGADAVMSAPADLPPPQRGVLGLLHDLAAFGAAVSVVKPKRTRGGTLAVADQRRLSERLGIGRGPVMADPRWELAWIGLEALGGVSTDPVSQVVDLEPALVTTLAGGAAACADRLVRRLVDDDLLAGVDLVRDMLRQAGEDGVDEVIFVDLVYEQARDLFFRPWQPDGDWTYPGGQRPWDRDNFERLEVPILRRLLSRFSRLGLLRRGEGVFAPTEEGQWWANAEGHPLKPPPPVWVSSDLEIVVPPHALTPSERFALERFSTCRARDVVDRFQLTRDDLSRWLATNTVEEVLELLVARGQGVSAAVDATLRDWEANCARITLTHGVRFG